MILSKRAVAATAIALTAGLMTACTADSPSTESGNGGKDAKVESGGNIVKIAETNTFTSLNSAHADHNKEINSKIARATTAALYTVTPDLKVRINTEIGNIEKVSDEPLTVKYTINEGINWSDDTPVDAGDLLLAWAYGSGYYDDAKTDEDGKVTSGTAYFNPAASTDGLGLTEFPEIGEDGRTLTLKYSKPYADWQTALDIPPVPAHIVAKRAGLADEAALIELFKKTAKGDPEAPKDVAELKKVGEVWNNDFHSESLPSDPELYLSSGPFIVKAIEAKNSMTLVRNDKYGGTKAKADEITVRYIGDANAAIQALRNGEIDIIAPQPSADTLTQAKELPGVKTITADDLSYDHIDLQFKGVFADKNVREAFMLTIPRKQIVDRVVGPLKEGAKPLDSEIFVATQPGYAESVAQNGSAEFADVNIEKAKELLGDKTPTVKIMYNKANPNRVDAFTLIQNSAGQAGFKVEDGGLPSNEWGKALSKRAYDATIFGWVSAGVGNGAIPQIYKTGGPGNFNGYSNAEVDKLSEELMVTSDEARQLEIKRTVDKFLFEDRYGLPLFQGVGMVAYNEKVTGLEYNPTSSGVWWDIAKVGMSS